MRNEAAIEKRLKTKVEALGGMCLKWVSPSLTGVPDRIVVHKGLHLVEVKDPQGKLSPKQIDVIKKLNDCGVAVHVVDSVYAVDAFVKGIE